MSHSVAILSRLSRAGIDAFTLQIGRALCSNFALEPKAQKQISEAIRNLRRYGSIGDVIWFGFGVKEVIRDLADTEEGLALVALCAGLSTAYDSFYIAQVLRELCTLCKAPGNLTPALHLWKALAEMCEGILMSSHFAKLASGIHRLMLGMLEQKVEECNEPTTPSALAQAIRVVARVSNHELISTSFFGGLDCAWLAAFSESILSLDVGIFDRGGKLVYRSRNRNNGFPQVGIVVRSVSPQQGLLTGKVTMLPSQKPLIYDLKNKEGVPSMLNCEGSWSTILHDVFGGQIDALLSDPIGHHFASYLSCVSCLRKVKPAEEVIVGPVEVLDRHPVNSLLWTYGSNDGRKFTEAASRCLPELSQCLSTHVSTVHGGEEPDTILNLGMSALESIVAMCSCGLHTSETASFKAAEPCLQTISETIIVFLWILEGCDIDSDISPSITGLKNLFVWVRDSNFRGGNSFAHGVKGLQRFKLRNPQFYTSLFDRNYPFTGIDLVFQVLSGSTGLATKQPPLVEQSYSTMTKTLARAGNGICVYYCLYKTPRPPLKPCLNSV